MQCRCWILTPEHDSTSRKGLGLADALGLKAILLTPDEVFLPDNSSLKHDWPDLLISVGQQTIETATRIRELSAGKTLSVFVQYPRTPGNFNLVIMPRHDDFPVSTELCVTEGALHDVTSQTLAVGKAQFPEFWKIPSPRIIVLIGATNATFRLEVAEASELVRQLLQLKDKYGAQLLISTSKRTKPEVRTAVEEGLKGEYADFWDGVSPNPYLGYLACADYVMVTPDSLSMICEATATTKPVYFFELPQIGDRHLPFFANMTRLGVARPFRGELTTWTYHPLGDIEKASSAIRQALSRKLR